MLTRRQIETDGREIQDAAVQVWWCSEDSQFSIRIYRFRLERIRSLIKGYWLGHEQ